ncbi:MAG: urate hydroxylase PuuD [Bacteroidota bacterium]
MSTLSIFIAILGALVVIAIWQMGGIVRFLTKRKKLNEISDTDEVARQGLSATKNMLIVGGLLVLFAGLLIFYLFVKDTPVESHFFEWMSLLVRWFHITIGIAWIGASFYFVFLENSLNRTKGLRKGIAGNLWAIHGGGFYYVEKYKNAPEEIPKELHWFKYEAYFTWISGFVLLCIVYYFNAKSFLIDPNVLNITPLTGVAIGVSTLIVGWIVYDLLCKFPLINHGIVFAAIGFLLMVGVAWLLTNVFNSRAAFIHVGALIGTLMAGNVFFVIIPSQKAMVAAAKEGKTPDPRLGKHAGLRSLHNNYFTLPVLFIMISNHYPSTFSHELNWLALAGISLGSALVKHYLNLIERGEYSIWVFPVGILMILAVAFMTSPDINPEACDDEVSFATIYPIVQSRCISCHSSNPTDEDWSTPPNGVKYDTPEEVAAKADLIMQRVVLTHNMPQNNKTGMTPEERDLIRCWIQQGASTK